MASEVKSLATQTAKATEDITVQIKAVQDAAKQSVAAINGIVRTIGSIDSISSMIAAAVEEQGAATSEIARNVQLRLPDGTNEVTSNVGAVIDAAGETGAVAGNALVLAKELMSEPSSSMKHSRALSRRLEWPKEVCQKPGFGRLHKVGQKNPCG